MERSEPEKRFINIVWVSRVVRLVSSSEKVVPITRWRMSSIKLDESEQRWRQDQLQICVTGAYAKGLSAVDGRGIWGWTSKPVQGDACGTSKARRFRSFIHLPILCYLLVRYMNPWYGDDRKCCAVVNWKPLSGRRFHPAWKSLHRFSTRGKIWMCISRFRVNWGKYFIEIRYTLLTRVTLQNFHKGAKGCDTKPPSADVS